jgi:ATP synthase protein I
MKEDVKRFMRLLTLVSTMGISMVLATIIGVIVGIYFDKWLGTEPYGFIFWLLIGIIAGFRNLYIIMQKAGKQL